MSRAWVSMLLCIVVWGSHSAAISYRAKLELNRVKFRGNYFLSSVPNYRHLSLSKFWEQKPTQIEGLPLLGWRDSLSAARENGQFDSEGIYDLHQLLVGRKGERVLLAVVDGLWGDTYLGGFAAERITSELKTSLARRSLLASLFALPEQLEIAVDKQVRGDKNSQHPDDYGATMPIAEDAGAFIAAAEIRGGLLNVAYVGNTRVLLIRDGEIIWQTQDQNPGYQVSSNPEDVINPADEGEGQVFKAIELPANMGASMVELVDKASITLLRGDRIIIASDSVGAACSNADLLNWTTGRSNADASSNARSQIAAQIASLNAGDDVYDDHFALIVYDYIPN